MNGFDIPPLPDIANASALVGLLFVVRYFVSMRRIWKVAGRPRGFVFGDYWRATKPLAYGQDLEPDRRHAARQLYVGLFFVAVGFMLLAWLLALNVLGPFFQQGALI